MYATDRRQTDVRRQTSDRRQTKALLNAGAGNNKQIKTHEADVA